MKLSLLVFSLLYLICLPAKAQLTAFRIFDQAGEETSFEALVKQAGESEIILFGELHNNSLGHWLQLRLLKALSGGSKEMILAGEFFEKDDQLSVDEWFAGKLTDKNFEAEAKLWNNYQTDYKPLLLFAKAQGIPFVASNVPRKYASLVSREGMEALDSLSLAAKRLLPPLPIRVDKELPGYVEMKDMMHGGSMNAAYMVEAQALKDATMAFSLLPFLNQEKIILHINGAYHNKNFDGINWYLKQASPAIQILNIGMVEQEDLNQLESPYQGMADFILVLPKDGPKSY